MADEIQRKEKLTEGIERILDNRTAAIWDYYEKSRSATPGDSLRKLRTSIKKLRALTRLARKVLGKDLYRKQQKCLRSIAHALSPSRDLEVQSATLHKLRRIYGNKIASHGYATLENLFKRESEAGVDSQPLKKARLKAALKMIEKWPLKKFRATHLHLAIKRSLQRYIKAQERVFSSLTDENLHEWRKRAKDLKYNLVIIHSIGPKSLDILIQKLNQLNDYLGHDHDYVLLEQRINRHHSPGVQRLHALIGVQRQNLQHAAFQAARIILRLLPFLVASWKAE
ncbi:MAG: domain containing protein [Verrucomicrobiales bacterium]|nr:domain containing protein [Verrucomicrobiales bacterium]